MNSKARRLAEAQVCCGLPAARGVCCPLCGKVARAPQRAKSAQAPTAPRAPVQAQAFPKPQKRERARKHPKPRAALPRRNRARAAKALIEDFGPLAVFVRTLPCCVDGCPRGPCDPAHVRSRGAGLHAWITIDGVRKGNIAPLCHPHHVEQGDGGIRTFQRTHTLIVRPGPGYHGVACETLREVAEVVGWWLEAGAEAGAPC